MSSGSSMQVTVGSTLGRAWDQNQDVDVLVEGQWISGRIAALDGMGVAIDGYDFERYVVRLETVSVVRIRGFAAAPALSPRQADPLGFGGVASTRWGVPGGLCPVTGHPGRFRADLSDPVWGSTARGRGTPWATTHRCSTRSVRR